jgi:thimet oligopeptidase
MWSLVIAKDLFGAFRAAGLMDPGVARRYRRAILEAGGTKPAAELVKDFLGRPHAFDAYEEWLNAG